MLVEVESTVCIIFENIRWHILSRCETPYVVGLDHVVNISIASVSTNFTYTGIYIHSIFVLLLDILIGTGWDETYQTKSPKESQ